MRKVRSLPFLRLKLGIVSDVVYGRPPPPPTAIGELHRARSGRGGRRWRSRAELVTPCGSSASSW